MKKRLFQFLFAALLAVILLPATVNTAHADSVTFSSGDFTYTITDGVASIESYNGSAASVTVPSTVYYDGLTYKLRTIGERAFEGNQRLQAIVIPQNITQIGNCAFKNCTNLSSVTINGDLGDCDDYSTREYYYSYSVFYNAGSNADSLTVTFSDSVTRIPAYLFGTGSSKSEGNYAHVTKVVMGKSVKEIGKAAFSRCYDLDTVTWGSALIDIGDYAFELTGLKIVSLPDKVEVLGENAFVNCQSLAKLTLPKSTTTLYDCAFKNCTNLSSVTINGDLGDCNNSWGHAIDQYSYDFSVFYNAGSNADSLTVTFGDSVTRIPAYLFATGSSKSDGNYAHVTRVNLPASLKEIGDCAFYNCYDLSKIYFRGNAPTFGDNCFYSVPATAYYPKNNSTWTASTRQNYGGDITWTAYSPAAITAQPKAVSGAVGDTVKFTVGATGAGLTYQWQYYTGSKWANSGMTGNKTATLSVPVTVARNGKKYRCVVKDKYGFTETSSAAKLTVVIPITTQPGNVTAPIGNTAKFTVKATGTGLTYQWQYNSGSGWANSGLTGSKTATLSVPVTAARNGYRYRCVITDANGIKTNSKAATLTVKTKITTQPTDKTVSAGTSVKFSVKATGVGLTYQWYYRASSTGTWKKCGQNATTLTVSATAARNGYQYKCVITDANGSKTYSNAVKLTVK